MPSSYDEAVRWLGAVSHQPMHIYDCCSGTDAKGKHCSMVYRNEYAGATQCPACSTPRLDSHGRPQRQLCYLSLIQWLRSMLADPELAR